MDWIQPFKSFIRHSSTCYRHVSHYACGYASFILRVWPATFHLEKEDRLIEADFLIILISAYFIDSTKTFQINCKRFGQIWFRVEIGLKPTWRLQIGTWMSIDLNRLLTGLKAVKKFKIFNLYYYGVISIYKYVLVSWECSKSLLIKIGWNRWITMEVLT